MRSTVALLVAFAWLADGSAVAQPTPVPSTGANPTPAPGDKPSPAPTPPPVVETTAPAVNAICRNSKGVALGQGVGPLTGAVYGAAAAYSLIVSPSPDIVFATPPALDEKLDGITAWSLCLETSSPGLTLGPVAPASEFSIVLLPATTVLSTDCTTDAATGDCTNSLAAYMAATGYRASRYWRLTQSSAGVTTVSVAVVQAPGGK